MAGAPTVRGLNHLTLSVADLERSLRFYATLLGLAPRARWTDGAYLTAGDLWLCLTVEPAGAGTRPHPDYTHFAFDVAAADFAALAEKVSREARSWRDNRSEGNSLYVLDPDGHKLELHVGSLQSRLAHYHANPRLDLEIIGPPDGPEP